MKKLSLILISVVVMIMSGCVKTQSDKRISPERRKEVKKYIKKLNITETKRILYMGDLPRSGVVEEESRNQSIKKKTSKFIKAINK